MGALQRISLAIVIIGAINWGLIGFFRFDLVATLFGGQTSFLARVVYALVGIAGLICIGLLFKPDEEFDESTEKRTSFNKLRYDTEFGREEDFSDIEKSEKDDKKNENR